jgi:hypothetical protein
MLGGDGQAPSQRFREGSLTRGLVPDQTAPDQGPLHTRRPRPNATHLASRVTRRRAARDGPARSNEVMSRMAWPWPEIMTTIARRIRTGSFAVRVIRCSLRPRPRQWPHEHARSARHRHLLHSPCRQGTGSTNKINHPTNLACRATSHRRIPRSTTRLPRSEHRSPPRRLRVILDDLCSWRSTRARARWIGTPPAYGRVGVGANRRPMVRGSAPGLCT